MSGRLREELAWGLADVAAVVLCVLAAPLGLLLWFLYGRR